MRTDAVAGVVVAVLVVVGFPAVGVTGGTAHGWYVDVDSQVSDDGTVVVRHHTALEDAYLAVHVVENGSLGRTVARTALEQGERTGLTLALDDAFWAGVDGPVRLAAAIHEDDGDGTFDYPDGDPIVESDGDRVLSAFTVAPSATGATRVVGQRQYTGGNVSLDRVDLARDGFVVLYEEQSGERGDVVGVRYLGAGHHENVSVSVDPRYYNDQSSRLYLVAGVHYDDGDGEWDPADDPAVTAGGDAVTATFDATKATSTVATATPTTTPSGTATAARTSTPSPTGTVSPTAGPTATTTTSGSARGTAAGSTTGTETATSAPGFGGLAALVALVGGLLVFGRQ